MKLRFLCANHRQWLQNQPQQAVQWCANSFETGWHLYQSENWKDALPHMGCAFETAEIVLTTRALGPPSAMDWFLRSLDGLTQTLEKLDLRESCLEVYQVAIDRLRKEAADPLASALDSELYKTITRLNVARRQCAAAGQPLTPMLTLSDSSRRDVVFH